MLEYAGMVEVPGTMLVYMKGEKTDMQVNKSIVAVGSLTLHFKGIVYHQVKTVE